MPNHSWEMSCDVVASREAWLALSREPLSRTDHALSVRIGANFYKNEQFPVGSLEPSLCTPIVLDRWPVAYGKVQGSPAKFEPFWFVSDGI